MNVKNLVSVSEAAIIAGVSNQAIQRWIDRGYIDAEKVGRQWVIDKKSLEAYLKTK